MKVDDLKSALMSTKKCLDNEYLKKYCQLIFENLETPSIKTVT